MTQLQEDIYKFLDVFTSYIDQGRVSRVATKNFYNEQILEFLKGDEVTVEKIRTVIKKIDRQLESMAYEKFTSDYAILSLIKTTFKRTLDSYNPVNELQRDVKEIIKPKHPLNRGYGDLKQISVDLYSDIEDMVANNEFSKDDLGSIIYDINLLVEVMNHSLFDYDYWLAILEELKDIMYKN